MAKQLSDRILNMKFMKKANEVDNSQANTQEEGDNW